MVPSYSGEHEMLTPIDDMEGDCGEETQRLRDMAVKAWNYVTAFNWCPPITGTWFAGGIGGVAALFLFEFETTIDGIGDRVWVVVGDLPSAYVATDADNPRTAFDSYCTRMDDWIEAVTVTKDFSNVFPVEAAQTKVSADALRLRLDFLRREIIPFASTESIDARPTETLQTASRWPNINAIVRKRGLLSRKRPV
jgi:hypothetical protein